jgi:DNA-binding response OmpR family regulator
MERIGAGYTILLIDDDRGLLPSLVAMIQALTDYTVVVAENGAEGLERFYATRPHCVVVDVKMPEIDGYQFARAVRGDPDSAETPIIFLSAMAQQANRFVGLASGGDHYLVKPVKPMDLLAAIRSAITISEDERQARMQRLAEAPDPIDGSDTGGMP